MRLQKFLAHAGVCSRRKAEAHILNGLVRVNDTLVNTLGTQVDPKKDKIVFQGQRITLKQQEKKIYIAVNKPMGFVSSCSQNNTKIIVDIVDIDERIYPVGRLDKDSTGLLLLTNDGDLHLRMSHPSFNHEKEYEVTTMAPVSDQDLNLMAKGMLIDGVKTRKAKVKRITKNKFQIILKQGLNRQIRKMVAQTGNEVIQLNRTRMANITLGQLQPGKWRHLTDAEISDLEKLLKK